jgi:hypothetical protein
MNPGEIRELLALALDEAQPLGLHVLIGALKADAREAFATIHDTSAWLASRTSPEPVADHLFQAHAPRTMQHPEEAVPVTRHMSPVTLPVCGFTVCPPRGPELTQAEIKDGLTSVLDSGFPTALYQLPQMTQNEISPELASELAARFENFLLFKDSSGADRIALSGKSLGGVFRLRGGEGDYARWLKLAGGPYDGFLLGSANCFASELDQVIQHLSAGRLDAANELSARLTAAVAATARLVASVPSGNPFANANKALDHFFAYGPRAAGAAPPRLYGGGSLHREVVRAAGEILERHRLMPARGYLE